MSIQYNTPYIVIKQMLERFHLDKINVIKNASFSLLRAPFSLKACVGFSIFDSVLFLLSFGFLFNKKNRILAIKRHDSSQNQRKVKK